VRTKSDTDQLKTGARDLDDQTLTSWYDGRRKRNSSPREGLCLLDRPANGWPYGPAFNNQKLIDSAVLSVEAGTVR